MRRFSYRYSEGAWATCLESVLFRELIRFCSEEFSKVRRRKQEISGFLPRPQHGTLNRFVDPSDTLDVKRNRGGNESS